MIERVSEVAAKCKSVVSLSFLILGSAFLETRSWKISATSSPVLAKREKA